MHACTLQSVPQPSRPRTLSGTPSRAPECQTRCLRLGLHDPHRDTGCLPLATTASALLTVGDSTALLQNPAVLAGHHLVLGQRSDTPAALLFLDSGS